MSSVFNGFNIHVSYYMLSWLWHAPEFWPNRCTRYIHVGVVEGANLKHPTPPSSRSRLKHTFHDVSQKITFQNHLNKVRRHRRLAVGRPSPIISKFKHFFESAWNLISAAWLPQSLHLILLKCGGSCFGFIFFFIFLVVRRSFDLFYSWF